MKKSTVMLDLETLAVSWDSVILTVGLLKFDPWGDGVILNESNSLYLKPNVDEQIAMGRMVSDSTVQWWGKQPEDVQGDALGDDGRLSGVEVVSKINKFMVGVGDIWCQGPIFDIPNLETYFKSFGFNPPWHYWQIRDCRTIFLVHGDPRENDRKAAHNALMDCYYQALGLQEIFKSTNVKNHANYF